MEVLSCRTHPSITFQQLNEDFLLSVLMASVATCATPDLVHIPAAPDFSFAADGDGSPVEHDFFIGKYPITNEEYARFCKATGHRIPRYWKNGKYPKGKGKLPVLWVSYDDAEAYCEWLSAKNPGKRYRLPTEAEWERAASGPRQMRYPWGNEAGISLKSGLISSNFNYNGVIASLLLKKKPTQKVTFVSPRSTRRGESTTLNSLLILNERGGVRGWQDHKTGGGFVQTDIFQQLNDEGGYTTVVDAYPKGVSAYGCFDMSGNAWEWTSSEIIATNGAERGQTVQAIRGGSWYATARSCSVTFRGEGRRAEGVFNTVGFRVAADDTDSTRVKPNRLPSKQRKTHQRSQPRF
ncbi:MAG: SUMF1/EgtB/PvdO family nonheme iron enzyme [Akkermansia sp.]|nr:SUMF1/EgtB/PvdO family nonheme iron enzyme [Akkermansia sp.]